jgi:hypothetical protein
MKVNVRLRVAENGIVDAVGPESLAHDCTHRPRVVDKGVDERSRHFVEMLVMIIENEQATAWEPVIVIQSQGCDREVPYRHEEPETTYSTLVAGTKR